MANTIDRKINPEIPIVQESNRNEVYVPNASYTEPGVAGFYKTHFIVDDNGIVHLRKAPERAVSAVTYDSNTNTLIITFDDGTVQSIKLNDCACVDGVDLIVYDAFNVIEFKETSWTTLDAGKVLVISSALTGYDNDEIIAQLDKYNVVTTNINDGTVTSNYQTSNEYQIYKCTDGSLVLFATEAFAGRFIILKREFAVQKNVASITYDDATGILTIYYVTGGSVEVFVKTNMQFGEGEGSTQQIGAKATGKQAAAFGGRRYDKPTDESRRITEAKGGNAFAAGGSVIADGDFTAAFGKQTKAEQSASFAAGTNTQAGKTLEEYVAAGGSADDYAKSYAAAAVFGDGNKAKGYADFVAGNANESDGTSNTTVGGANKVKGIRNFTGGEANEVGQSGLSDVGNALTFGQHLKNTGRWNRVTFGQFNADDLAALLEIGNGTSDTDRVNIFVVKDNGAIYAGKLGKLHQGTRFQVSDGNSESDRRALIDSRHNGVTHIESYMSTLNGSVGNGNKVAASESGELKDIADPTDGNYPLLNTFLAGQGLQNKGRYNQIVFGQFNEFDPLALFQVGTGNSDTDRKKGFRVDYAGRAKSDTAAAGDEFYVRVADLGEHFAFPFADPNNWTIDYDATSTGEGLTITGNLRIYVKKGSTDATSVYHDIPNAKISIPIKAGDGISIDKADGEEWLVVKATGGGGTSEYANTSEIVDANLTLTNSSTLTDFVNAMSAEKTKVIRVNNDNAAYTQVRRILDNPETSGPPSSVCCFYFKFISTDLIQAYYGYSSNYLLASTLAKFPTSGWGHTNWRAFDAENSIPTQLYSVNPSSTAITVLRSDENSFPSMLLSLHGNFAESYRQGIIVSTSALGNRGIMIGDHDIVYVNDSDAYFYLRANNVKTLFGNQSIYGSGNIDLYRHNIVIDADGVWFCFVVWISSVNTPIDSLSDLQTYIGQRYPISGEIRDLTVTENQKWCPCFVCNFDNVSGGSVNFINGAGESVSIGISSILALSTITITDTVTTV